MANDVNQVVLSGRLGKNPALRTSAKGTPFASFSVANNRQTDFGEQTSWFNVLVWGQELALPVSRRIAKGQHVTVVGRLETTFNKETGQSYFGLVAEDVQATTNPGKPQDINRVTIAGRIGREARFRLVGKNGDKPMLSFSVASSSEDDYNEKTCWVNIVVWGDYARQLSQLKLTKGQHVTVTGYLETRHLSQSNQEQSENNQAQLFGQVVATHVAINDRSSFKRNSGAGNGAQQFAHSSQQTTFDRYTNETQPELAESMGNNHWSGSKGWQVAELNRMGEIYRYHGDPFPASPLGKLAAQKLATQLGSQTGKPQQFKLRLVDL